MEKSEQNGTEASSTFQCMSCSLRIDAEEAPEECPKCGSQLSFARVADWRFF